MAKTVTLQWKPFFDGMNIPKENVKGVVLKSSLTGALTTLIFTPEVMSAAGNAVKDDGAWWKLLEALWNMSDWFCVGVIIFAGGMWMMGNRPQAISLISGGAIGYLVIRHALDIQRFLHGI